MADIVPFPVNVVACTIIEPKIQLIVIFIIINDICFIVVPPEPPPPPSVPLIPLELIVPFIVT